MTTELQLGQTVQVVPFLPKIFINSFPKSGTHLANLICAHIAKRQEPKHWLGTFRGNSWTTQWVANKHLLPVIEGQQPGTWYQGHVGYRPALEEAFKKAGVCMFFIYRDPRDVAVSLAYHIENPDDKKAAHPDKERFKALGGHKEILMATITGLGKYPGVIERWELYAPWLDVNWIHPVRFEDMRSSPRETAEKAIDYVVKRTLAGDDVFTFIVKQNVLDAIEKSEELLGTTEYSASYRKGKAGGWRDEFTPEMKEAFKERAGDWLVRLGYEEDNDW